MELSFFGAVPDTVALVASVRCKRKYAGWLLLAPPSDVTGDVRAVASQSLRATNGGEPKWSSKARRPAPAENAHAKDLVAQKTIR